MYVAIYIYIYIYIYILSVARLQEVANISMRSQILKREENITNLLTVSFSRTLLFVITLY